jgi:hypothetical protein
MSDCSTASTGNSERRFSFMQSLFLITRDDLPVTNACEFVLEATTLLNTEVANSIDLEGEKWNGVALIA